jgi:hypothetical protein
MFYFDNFVVSLPIRPIVYRRCSPQSFEICLREKSRSPHTHTPVSLSGLSVFLCVCLSMEPSLSPFEPEKRENGGDERESSWQRRPQVLSVSQVGHGRRRRRREEAVHDGLSPPPTTTVRLLRNWCGLLHLLDTIYLAYFFFGGRRHVIIIINKWKVYIFRVLMSHGPTWKVIRAGRFFLTDWLVTLI